MAILKHHILRITRDDWIRQVFEVRKYYSGMIPIKGWKVGSTVVFLGKVGKMDSVIGWGIIEGIEKIDDMTVEEKTMCQENGWKYAVRFGDLERLSTPKPLKETPLVKWDVKGRFFNGRTLTDEELETILS